MVVDGELTRTLERYDKLNVELDNYLEYGGYYGSYKDGLTKDGYELTELLDEYEETISELIQEYITHNMLESLEELEDSSLIRSFTTGQVSQHTWENIKNSMNVKFFKQGDY